MERIAAFGQSPWLLGALDDVVVLVVPSVEDAHELRTSDGTPDGTRMLRAFREITQATVRVAGRLIFIADDGVHGMQLWGTDATPGGTGLVRVIGTGERDGLGNGYPSLWAATEDLVYFSAGPICPVSSGGLTAPRMAR